MTAAHDSLFRYFHQKSPLTKEEFARFSRFFTPKKVKRNEVLLREGEICQCNFFVVKGCLRFYSINSVGEIATRYFAFEGKFATALSSLIEGKPSREYIQAAEPCELLQVSKTDYLQLVETVPQVNKAYRHLLEMAYVTSQQRIYHFLHLPALERLKWVMEQHPGILTRLSGKMVASYLGVTPYTLSRLKSQL